ncbi:MAG: RNA repair transcriptional activator RtcR [Planctomycetota bacterium]|jgi:transcriptional regulatory protein RtcR
MSRPISVVGFVGSRKDAIRKDRWGRWRPSVAIAQQEDLEVDRFDLLYLRRDSRLARTIASDIHSVSPGTDVRLHGLDIDDPWDLEQVYTGLHDFALERAADPEREELLVHMTTGTHVVQICLFLLTESHHLPGDLLQTRPPEVGEGPEGGWSRVDLNLERYDGIARRFAKEHDAGTHLLKSGIDTRNAAFNALIDELEVVAERSLEPILLLGPTGAGKSQLARRIYELKRSKRQFEGEFVELNCATLRGDGAASALFGHKKGAFTGAVSDRPGLLRAADGGLLFLDEIGELGLDEQAMLLRAIEERRFLPVGSDREVESRFQLICGTNRDLGDEVRDGNFREDLLARIDLWSFRLPALRERREDLEPNLDYALAEWERERGDRVTFNREARRRYLAFAAEAAWERNFRDLNASVARLATLARGGRVDRDLVEAEIGRLERHWAPQAGDGAARVQALLGARAEELDRFDRLQLEQVVAVTAGCRSLSEAGRMLFDRSRLKRRSVNDADRLRKYLARFGLSFEDLRDAAHAP